MYVLSGGMTVSFFLFLFLFLSFYLFIYLSASKDGAGGESILLPPALAHPDIFLQ